MVANLNHVLVVDDDPAMLRLLRAQLSGAGYQVSCTTRGDEAHRIVKTEQPSYLITDLDMPGMNGLELCRAVRQLKAPNYQYIVFLTSRAEENDVIKAMAAGADDFLVKPVRRQEMLARLSAGARVLHLESRLSRMAAYDELSGLLTRHPFNDFLDKEWSRAKRMQLPLSVAMIDIDFFKQVNDTYGHTTGDQVIRAVADLVRASSRGHDVACRYGGEEFCVMLPETDARGAEAWAENLRRHVWEVGIPTQDVLVNVSVSIGVAELDRQNHSATALLDSADQCLIAAKQRGRNRTVTANTLHGECQLLEQIDALGLSSATAMEAMDSNMLRLSVDCKLQKAAEYILHEHRSSVIVVNSVGVALGILTDRDVLSHILNPDSAEMRLSELTIGRMISYPSNAPLSLVLKYLTRAACHSALITDEQGSPLGIVSRSSVLQWVMQTRRELSKEQQDSELCP